MRADVCRPGGARARGVVVAMVVMVVVVWWSMRYHGTMSISEQLPGVPVDIPGWPLARIETIKGTLITVLARWTGRDGEEMHLIVCPHCRRTPLAVSRKQIVPKRKGIASCGCRKGYGKNPDCTRQKKPK